MQANYHYPTFVAFFLREDGSQADVISLDCTIGNAMPGKALIRKRCICGSVLDFDWDQDAWVCGESGALVNILGRNLEPLITAESAVVCPEKYRHLPSEPDCEGVPTVDEDGLLHLLVMVPHEDLWLLVDPISVEEYITVKKTETAPITIVYYDIGDIGMSPRASLSREVFLNVLDPEHKDYLQRLASGSEVHLHFVNAANRVVVGTKRIKRSFGAPEAFARALEFAAQIPAERYDFDTALTCLKLGGEASRLRWTMRWLPNDL